MPAQGKREVNLGCTEQCGRERAAETNLCTGQGCGSAFPAPPGALGHALSPSPYRVLPLRNFFYYCSCTIAWIIHLNSAINKYSLFALTSQLRITPKMFAPLRFSTRLGLRAVRYNSTSAPATPPLMAKIRTDLKNAMRAKDTPRY